jgi:hypothetical protein
MPRKTMQKGVTLYVFLLIYNISTQLYFKWNPKTLTFYQGVNSQKLCALALASFGTFYFDSLQIETLGLVKILSPFTMLKYILPNT